MKQYSTEEQQRRAKINKRKKMLRMPLTILENIIYRIRNFYKNKIYYPIRWFFQRGIRGYDDTAHWSMHDWFIDIAPKIIREIKNRMPGHPVDFTYEGWMNTLETMASCFENAKKEEELSYDDFINHNVHSKKEIEYTEKGLDMFKKYFFNLWW